MPLFVVTTSIIVGVLITPPPPPPFHPTPAFLCVRLLVAGKCVLTGRGKA